MEHIKKQDAVKHENSPNCTVYEYPTKNSEINIGVAEISDRYPEQGYAMNHTCIEMGYILKGSGKLVTEAKTVILSAGDVVLIPSGERFFWEGNMTIVLPTTPAWNPQQYSLVPEDALLKPESL